MYIKDKCYCSKCLREIAPGLTCPFCGFDADFYESPKYALPLDSIIGERYQVGCVIGSGGFGITYAGWDLSLNKPVAVKEFFPRSTVSRNTEDTFFVTPNGSEDNQLIYYKGVNWFQREARILAVLNDTPNIVHVEDYFKENGTAYIIMDFIRGKPLSVYAREKGGRLDSSEVFDLMRKPIEALQKVHTLGMIHRDISPDNLILSENGDVIIIDFGAATSLDEDSELKATELFMNKSFAPPEQESEKDQGTWSDIYAICSTMVFLIIGEKIPLPMEREQRDAVSSILAPLNLKKKQKKALLHGLNLKIKLRTENTAVLLNELYNVPLPKTEVEKKRQKQLIKRLITGFIVSYVLLCAGLFLNLNKIIPACIDSWIYHDFSAAMHMAERYARGDYIGGSVLTNYWYHWIGSNGDDEKKCEVAEKYQENTFKLLGEDIEYEYLKKDYEYAEQLLIEAGENGYSGAYNRLGWMYWKGEYVQEKNIDLAIQYLKKASSDGNTLAMTNLALLYLEEFDDFDKAFPLLNEAAEKKDIEAMYHLAMIYDQGVYVEEDTSKALKLMLKAAAAGQPDAEAIVGNFYLCNDLMLDSGVKWRDLGTGLYWLSVADFEDSVAAAYYWALIYRGDTEISESLYAEGMYKEEPEKSFAFMLKAAENGYIPAMKEVSQMYETGYGTDVDLDSAKEWSIRAESASSEK